MIGLPGYLTTLWPAQATKEDLAKGLGYIKAELIPITRFRDSPTCVQVNQGLHCIG